MSLATYDDLVSAIDSYLDGAIATSRIPDCIALAEAEFRRQLVLPEQETTLTIGTDALTPLPDGIKSIRSLTVAGPARGQVVAQVPPGVIAEQPYEGAGVPMMFSVSNKALSIYPMPSAPVTATLIYRQTIPSFVAGSPIPFLYASHPDLYLFGALLQAEFYGWNDERLPVIKSRVDEIIDQVNAEGQRKRYGGPLVMRSSVVEGVRGAYR